VIGWRHGDVEADETYIGRYRLGCNGREVGKTGVAIARLVDSRPMAMDDEEATWCRIYPGAMAVLRQNS
jgi:hypothetical protein